MTWKNMRRNQMSVDSSVQQRRKYESKCQGEDYQRERGVTGRRGILGGRTLRLKRARFSIGT